MMFFYYMEDFIKEEGALHDNTKIRVFISDENSTISLLEKKDARFYQL